MKTGWLLVTGLCMATALAQVDLPVSRVVLYRSGVGYIERTGTVNGNARIQLSLREPQMNDILKSLVLVDFDGGRIEPVQYTTRDPLNRVLSSYAVNIADNPSRAELLKRLRGVPVEVFTQSPIKGTILSVEERVVRDEKSGQTRTEPMLHLFTNEGITTVALSEVSRFRVLDERLQKEMENALAALASGLDTNRKVLELAFTGRGQRRVLIGYITEMPLWKMSYRLVIPREGKPLLQGWAIVENTTDEDWENVQITVVSGKPVSFIQNLYEPIYIKRPEYRPRLDVGIMPEVPQAPLERDAEEMKKRAAPAPDAFGGAAGRPLALGEAREAMAESLEPMAEGQAAGALFEYRVQTPVSIRRQQSAMLPVINQTIDAEPVSLYNPGRNAQHPLFGVRLTNTTHLTLMEGPVTVYYDDAYGGDALLDTVEPEDTRVITYALDTNVEVSVDTGGIIREVLTTRIVRGVLEQRTKLLRTTRYTLRNRGTQPRAVLVEQPYDGEWTLLQPSAEERTRDFYRFRRALAANQTDTFEVREERVVSETYALLTADIDSLQLVLRNTRPSEAMRKAIQEIIERRRQIALLQSEVRREQQKIESIERDQERIRQNMAQLDRASDLYKQYVQKLTQQEREIEGARERIERLQKQISDAQQALNDYIQGLNVE